MEKELIGNDTDRPLRVNEKMFNNNVEAMTALRLINETDHPIFLTGKAGTGKSTLLKLITQSSMFPLICAPTGVAARNVGGSTIHSAFNLPPKMLFSDDEDVNSINFRKNDMEYFSAIDRIIIDEVSMISSAMLDSISVILQRNLRTQEPFGGKKLILIGDLFQLPPIIKEEEKQRFNEAYDSEYFFDSNFYKTQHPISIELERNYRQKDQKFMRVLNSIRRGVELKNAVSTLNYQSNKKDDNEFFEENPFAITLTFNNKSADQINITKLNEINSEEYVFNAKITGTFDWTNVVAEKELRLKVGAKVMFIRNDLEEKAYVNGTLGEVVRLNQEKLIIRTEEGREIELNRSKWVTEEYKSRRIDRKWQGVYEEKGRMYQFPVKLAWAITVHKSQGLTFDSVLLRNDSPCFAYGQLYVALSRCRSLEKLKLFRPLRIQDIKVDHRIIRFSNKILHDKERVNLILKEIESRNQNAKSLAA